MVHNEVFHSFHSTFPVLAVSLLGHQRFHGVTSQLPNITHIDFSKYPLSANLKALTVVLEPGDLFFLPAYWWHEVRELTVAVPLAWCYSDLSINLSVWICNIERHAMTFPCLIGFGVLQKWSSFYLTAIISWQYVVIKSFKPITARSIWPSHEYR